MPNGSQTGDATDVGGGGAGVSRLTKPTLKFLVALGVLFGAQQVVLRVPAVSKVTVEISAYSVSVGKLLSSLISLLVVVSVLKFAYDSGTVFSELLPDVPRVRRLSVLVGALASLFVAYQSFNWVLDFYPEYSNHYDVAFLVVGLLIGGWMGLILYTNIGRIADILFGKGAG
ncbi:MAG: hypothetical protein SV760_00545 [Halobacteria archaeon]|nr:hypothetical protein [Halobacteria archaeon]